MPIRVTAWFDFVCPWCLLALSELDTLKGEFELKQTWKPFYLRPETPDEGTPLPPRILAFIADMNNPLRQRANALGLKMVFAERFQSTRRAHQAARFAELAGKQLEFQRAVLTQHWMLGQDISRWEPLRAAAQEVGLDPDAMQAEVDAGKHVEAVEASYRQAQEMGINAVPTFVIENKYAVQGAQEAETFREVFHEVLRTAGSPAP